MLFGVESFKKKLSSAFLRFWSIAVLRSKPNWNEEPLKRYYSGGYHPVRLGDFMGPRNRFKVIKKLGWGMYSTVWLARDMETSKYVALKILIAHCSTGEVNEVNLLGRTRDGDPEDLGYPHVVQLLDSFYHTGPNGTHVCMTFDVMATVTDLCVQLRTRRLPILLVKLIARDVLRGLDYLHRQCGIIHTDIKPDNILLSADDLEASIVKYVADNTCGRINSKRRRKSFKPIRSCNLPLESLANQSLNFPEASSIIFKLGDLGQGNLADNHFTDWIQSPALRAPEIILGAPWDSSVDIWNLGCVIYELLTGETLFDPSFQTKELGLSSSESHLIQIMDLFGDLPKDLLRRGKQSKRWFTDSGLFRLKTTIYPISLDALLAMRLDEDDVPLTTSFLLAMLQLRPHERLTADELLDHPWFQS